MCERESVRVSVGVGVRVRVSESDARRVAAASIPMKPTCERTSARERVRV